MKARRILIADKSENIRRRLRTMLAGHPLWSVVEEAAVEGDLLTKVNDTKPDIVVMDIAAPVLGGLSAAKKILAMRPNTKIVVLSASNQEELIRGGLQLGILGYISKPDFSREIISAICSVMDGRRFLDGRASEIVMRGYLEGRAGAVGRPATPSRLTNRELEIVRLLALGEGNKQIAAALGIRVRTVETHRANIMRKLNLHTLAELIHYAVSHQIIHIHAIPMITGSHDNAAR